VIVGLHLPAFDALAGSCEASPAPCRDLAAVELWGRPYGGGEATVRLTRTLSPADAGAWLELELTDPERPTWLWAVTLDAAGNASCASDSILVPPPAGIPPAPGAVPDVPVVFDVAGRRVTTGEGWQRRVPAGVYLERRGPRVRRLLVLH
jgi:hypothetical protein